jgi:hypothetical protein
MGRRKQSGFFESMLKSAFGTGTTVHYKTDWLGRKQKVVKHHDSGKTKTYTHGAGLFGNKTRSKTVKNGKVVEEGTVRKNVFFSGATESATKRDGTKVHRSYSPGIFKDHVRTSQTGVCFKCDGSGEKRLKCKTCEGSGSFTLPDVICYACDGSGIFYGRPCHRCKSGIYSRGSVVECKSCGGAGGRTVTCDKCNGSGNFTRTNFR